jgi:hypothetical protein
LGGSAAMSRHRLVLHRIVACPASSLPTSEIDRGWGLAGIASLTQASFKVAVKLARKRK